MCLSCFCKHKRINYTPLLLCLGERNVKYKELKKREETMDGRFLCVIFRSSRMSCLLSVAFGNVYSFEHFLIKYMFMEIGSCYVST